MTLRRKLAWIAVLYFAQGLPFGIAYDVWPVYFRVHGVSLTEIGLMSLLSLPWTLKLAWAPLVDRWGARQHWITPCLFVLSGATLALAPQDAGRATWWLWATLLVFTTADFRPVMFFGVLVVVTLAATAVGTLVTLPSLLGLDARARAAQAGRRGRGRVKRA